MEQTASSKAALVLGATRRYVEVFDPAEQKTLRGKIASRNLDPCAGDRVVYEFIKNECIVNRILHRTSCLMRSYGGKVKQIAANISHLFVIAAPDSLFNTNFIDRVAAAAFEQNIEWTLIVNKCDLKQELHKTSPQIDIYRQGLCSEVIFTSAKAKAGLSKLRAALEPPGSVFLFAGVSGVGKSTLLKTLIPEASVQIGDISKKTGQGRQTTSYPRGYVYRPGALASAPSIIVDLPGIQNYGVSHLDLLTAAQSFPEIQSLSKNCRYPDCSHIKEKECAVRKGVTSGEISKSRYCSYLSIAEEIKAVKRY